MGKPDLLTAVDAIYASVLDPGALGRKLSTHIALPCQAGSARLLCLSRYLAGW